MAAVVGFLGKAKKIIPHQLPIFSNIFGQFFRSHEISDEIFDEFVPDLDAFNVKNCLWKQS